MTDLHHAFEARIGERPNETPQVALKQSETLYVKNFCVFAHTALTLYQTGNRGYAKHLYCSSLKDLHQEWLKMRSLFGLKCSVEMISFFVHNCLVWSFCETAVPVLGFANNLIEGNTMWTRVKNRRKDQPHRNGLAYIMKLLLCFGIVFENSRFSWRFELDEEIHTEKVELLKPFLDLLAREVIKILKDSRLRGVKWNGKSYRFDSVQ